MKSYFIIKETPYNAYKIDFFLKKNTISTLYTLWNNFNSISDMLSVE